MKLMLLTRLQYLYHQLPVEIFYQLRQYQLSVKLLLNGSLFMCLNSNCATLVVPRLADQYPAKFILRCSSYNGCRYVLGQALRVSSCQQSRFFQLWRDRESSAAQGSLSYMMLDSRTFLA